MFATYAGDLEGEGAIPEHVSSFVCSVAVNSLSLVAQQEASRRVFDCREREGEEEMLERVPALESLECCFALPLRSAPREDIYIQEECADAGLSLRTTRKLCNARRGLIGQ